MKIDKTLPVHYRYDSQASRYGVSIVLSRMYPTRQTECFYFLIHPAQQSLHKAKERRVGKFSVRKYCYPTKEQALLSFKLRQEKRVEHAERSMAIAKRALRFLDDNDVGTLDSINIGMPEPLENFYEI